jgi:two-component SAPR family response regulator
MAAIDDALRASRRPIEQTMTIDDLEPIIALYRGPYLPDESEQPSYIATREQVRTKLLHRVARRMRAWEEAGEWDAVADVYLRLIEADDLCEGFYRNLMLCYERSGDHIEALATYERLRITLSARLNSEPSAETQAAIVALGMAAGRAS